MGGQRRAPPCDGARRWVDSEAAGRVPRGLALSNASIDPLPRASAQGHAFVLAALPAGCSSRGCGGWQSRSSRQRGRGRSRASSAECRLLALLQHALLRLAAAAQTAAEGHRDRPRRRTRTCVWVLHAAVSMPSAARGWGVPSPPWTRDCALARRSAKLHFSTLLRPEAARCMPKRSISQVQQRAREELLQEG